MDRFVVNSCCCGCCSLKTGTKIVGWFLLIINILSTLALINAVVYKDEITREHPELKDAHPAIFCTLVFSIIGVVVSGCYLYGVYKDTRSFTWPLMIWIIIQLILLLIAIILVAISRKKDVSQLISTILFFAILLYCLIIIWSDYNDMGEDV